MADVGTASRRRSFFENLNKNQDVDINHVDGWKRSSVKEAGGDENHNNRKPKTSAKADNLSAVGESSAPKTQTNGDENHNNENGKTTVDADDGSTRNNPTSETQTAGKGNRDNDNGTNAKPDADEGISGQSAIPDTQTIGDKKQVHENVPQTNEDEAGNPGKSATSETQAVGEGNHGNKTETGADDVNESTDGNGATLETQEIRKESHDIESGNKTKHDADDGIAGESATSGDQTIDERKRLFNEANSSSGGEDIHNNENGTKDTTDAYHMYEGIPLSSTAERQAIGEENHGYENSGSNTNSHADDAKEDTAGASSTYQTQQGKNYYDNGPKRKNDADRDDREYVHLIGERGPTQSQGTGDDTHYYDYERIIGEREKEAVVSSSKEYVMMDRRMLYFLIAAVVVVCLIAIIALILASLIISKVNS